MRAMNWGQRKAPLDSPFSTHRRPALRLKGIIEKRKIYNFDAGAGECTKVVNLVSGLSSVPDLLKRDCVTED